MKWKKVLASFLVITLLFGVLPTTAFAASIPMPESAEEVPADTEYTINGPKEISSFFVLTGTLTVESAGILTLTSEAYLLFDGGKINVKNGGKLNFENFASTVDSCSPGDLVFEVGAMCKGIEGNYIPNGFKLSAQADEEGYYTIEANTTLTGKVRGEKFQDLKSAFNGFLDSKVYDSAKNYITKTPNLTIQDVESALETAKKHVKYLQQIADALTKARDAVTKLPETYKTQYADYATDYFGVIDLTDDAERAVTTNLNKTAGVYYNEENVESYTPAEDQTMSTNAQNAIEKITTAQSVATEAVNSALSDAAKSAIKEKIHELSGLTSKEEYTKELDSIGTGPDGVLKAMKIYAKAKLQEYADKIGASEAVKNLVEHHQDAVDGMKNVDMVDYALNTAISEIDKQEKADSTLSTKRSDAETAAQSYITTTANAEAGTKDWNERIGKLTDKEKHTLKKLQEEVNANVKSYLTAIQKAQTQEALDSAVASFNAAAELEAERILAGWQLDEKAGNDPTLQETAETYKGYIDLSKDVGSIKQLLDTGLKEMDSQGSLVTARNAAKNTIKDHVKKIYTDYSSYFSDFSFTPDNEPSFWSAFEKKFDSANSLLKTWNTNIETSTDSVSITNVLTENAQSKLDDQFIKDLAADLVIKLGTEATGRKFCNPETPTVSGEPLVKVYDFDDLSKFKTSLESSIGTADPKVGTAEARADRTISAYNDALGQLADAEAFSLTVIGLGAEPTTNYYKNGDTVFLEASTMDEKQHAFKNWTCGERTVGTRRLTVTMTKNCEWTANYREDERPYAPPSENKQHITAKLDEDKLTLRATREIYNGSVKQHGILFSTFSPKLEFSNDYERDITTGYIMQDGARVSISNKIDDTEIGTYEVSMVWGRANPKSPQIYARGYYILEDGTVHYSENVVVITQNEGKWDNTANSDSTKTYEDIQSKGCGL